VAHLVGDQDAEEADDEAKAVRDVDGKDRPVAGEDDRPESADEEHRGDGEEEEREVPAPALPRGGGTWREDETVLQTKREQLVRSVGR